MAPLLELVFRMCEYLHGDIVIIITFNMSQPHHDPLISFRYHLRAYLIEPMKSPTNAFLPMTTRSCGAPNFVTSVNDMQISLFVTILTTEMKPEKDYRKSCTLCAQLRNVLVRCQIDETRRWHFLCPGSCWQRVSGGVVDGDEDHQLYRYGGMWKNKHEATSAKKPKRAGKRVKQTQQSEASVNSAGSDCKKESEGDKARDPNCTLDQRCED